MNNIFLLSLGGCTIKREVSPISKVIDNNKGWLF